MSTAATKGTRSPTASSVCCLLHPHLPSTSPPRAHAVQTCHQKLRRWWHSPFRPPELDKLLFFTKVPSLGHLVIIVESTEGISAKFYPTHFTEERILGNLSAGSSKVTYYLWTIVTASQAHVWGSEQLGRMADSVLCMVPGGTPRS